MLDNTVLGAQTADPMRFKRLRRRVVFLGVLVVVAFAGASAYDAWRSYKSTLSATHREITNVAAALAEQTAWTFQGVDLLLRDTARWYENDRTKIAPERLNEILANRSSGVRQIRVLTITDAQGIQIHRSVRIRTSPSRRLGPFLLHCAAGQHGGRPVHERSAHYAHRGPGGNRPVTALGGRERGVRRRRDRHRQPRGSREILLRAQPRKGHRRATVARQWSIAGARSAGSRCHREKLSAARRIERGREPD